MEKNITISVKVLQQMLEYMQDAEEALSEDGQTGRVIAWEELERRGEMPKLYYTVKKLLDGT